MQKERANHQKNTTPPAVPPLAKPPIKGMGGLIQLVAWGILFFIPFFFTGREQQSITLESYLHFLKIPVSFMIIFYANYIILVKKIPVQKTHH